MKNLFGFVDRLLDNRVAYYNFATGDDCEPTTKLWMSKSSMAIEGDEDRQTIEKHLKQFIADYGYQLYSVDTFVVGVVNDDTLTFMLGVC
jgi:hypothetical protein